MSEEKPTFKVTDRRLFNSDGSPRADIPRAEETPAAAAVEPAPAAAGAQTESVPEQRERAQPAQPGREAEAAGHGEQREADGPREAQAAAEQQQQEEGGAEADPTPFANLVMFIASPAAAAMGMTEHPGLAPGEVDLPLAKHCIDLLAIVREKSRGNLSQQEQQIIDGLLAELRMQYVSLTSAPRPAAPRGFTGGDITGGR